MQLRNCRQSTQCKHYTPWSGTEKFQTSLKFGNFLGSKITKFCAPLVVTVWLVHRPALCSRPYSMKHSPPSVSTTWAAPSIVPFKYVSGLLVHNSLNVLRRTPSEYSETYIIKASNATTRRNVEQERLSKCGADGRQTSLKFGNFLSPKNYQILCPTRSDRMARTPSYFVPATLCHGTLTTTSKHDVGSTFYSSVQLCLSTIGAQLSGCITMTKCSRLYKERSRRT